ncbi:unnamed protein product [Pseudo-nitzschia multistriata]|uniref:Uncharacterized protein n=1 Tax=Pseudo-nitzschia multistriata TaxID=183589 RepID=A0A448ZQF7_9STRA|nr:unnamed protein product [Pseudo-nitzschia multistriata]
MGLFRKKNRGADADFDIDFDDYDNSSIPREVNTKGARHSRSRSLGKIFGGSSSKKTDKKGKRKSGKGNNNSGSMEKINYSSSTSTSSNRDARDDRPQTFRASTSKAKSETKSRRHNEDYGQVNSLCSIPPTAADAAFHGPPRFDWIDIEFNAATMIQAVFRRYLVLQSMEREGVTTSYIRNRKRQRKASTKMSYFQTSTVDETAPDLGFGCCAMGFDLCGNDYDAADLAAYRTFQRRQYEERKKAQKDREEFLSRSYMEQKGIDTSIMLRGQSLIDA